ncbi:MAG TPA: RDD family protein [Thermoanaerobaculia bacterium]|jgi:uncharacterized RDD family membrane protein YckC|nr:RDD family protein [Thermoanaerobaculia bacterium]
MSRAVGVAWAGRAKRQITTPEHVRVRLEPAGPGSRFLALLVDVALILAITALASSTLSRVLPRSLSTLAIATLSFILTWIYHVGFEIRREGRTPGKAMLGLRVVDARGLPLSLEQSFVRNVGRVLDFAPLFYGLGGMVALLDRDGRRLGDLLADTLVVRDEGGSRRRMAAADLPETLRREGAAPVDVELARLARHRLSLDERELLVALVRRADKLDPRARYDLFEQAGRHFRRKIGLDLPHLSGEALVRALATAIAAKPGARR